MGELQKKALHHISTENMIELNWKALWIEALR